MTSESLSEPVDYSGRMAQVYNSGRTLPEEALRLWSDVAARNVVIDDGLIIDLGAGTGRFLGPLRYGTDRFVVAVEPAEGMRTQAANLDLSGVAVIGGRAECVPLADKSVALVWMSQSIHHVEDLEACGREVRRVLLDGGRVLLRGIFDLRGWILGDYFPAAERLAARFPTREQITDAFRRCSLRPIAHETFDQVSVSGPTELVARTRLRADSTLARISDAEFELGLRRLVVDVEAGLFDGPIVDCVEALSFGAD